MLKSLGSLSALTGYLCFVSALLFLAALPVSGSLVLIVYTGLWALLGFGLMRDWRWLAYFGFLFALVGAVACYIALGAENLTLSWLYTLLTATQTATAILLFLQLWPTKTA